MLVLQRKKNDSILINGNIKITIQEVGSDWVRLAIDAPKDIPILRAELVEAAFVNRSSTAPEKLPSLKKFLYDKKNDL